jgi:vacuolar-type H+-ATPase catalytic subunit A/Vma1
MLSPADLQIAKTNLVAAQAAYHSLVLGNAVASFKDSNGESVTYTAASASRLADYIKTLQDQINPCARISAPMRFWF